MEKALEMHKFGMHGRRQTRWSETREYHAVQSRRIDFHSNFSFFTGVSLSSLPCFITKHHSIEDAGAPYDILFIGPLLLLRRRPL